MHPAQGIEEVADASVAGVHHHGEVDAVVGDCAQPADIEVQIGVAIHHLGNQLRHAVDQGQWRVACNANGLLELSDKGDDPFDVTEDRLLDAQVFLPAGNVNVCQHRQADHPIRFFIKTGRMAGDFTEGVQMVRTTLRDGVELGNAEILGQCQVIVDRQNGAMLARA